MNGKVSIIILNYYGKNDTVGCLDSLEKTGDKKFFKVVLVNNSPDEIFSQTDLTKYSYNIDYVCPDKNYGFAGGCNIGIKKAFADPECSYIMLLNNDTLVTDCTVSGLIKHAENSGDTLFNPVIVFYHTRKVQCTGGAFNLFLGLSRNINKNRKIEDIRQNIEPDYLNGCCIFAGKNLFKQTGLFDERFFMYCEDLDFSIRAKKQGFKLCAVNDSVIYHKHSQSTDSSKKQFYICRNTVWFVIKNYGYFFAAVIAPVYFITQILAGLMVYKNRNVLSVIKLVCRGFFEGFKKNKL